MVSPANICPRLLHTLIIGNNAPLIAELSSVLARKRSYLPVIDEPRIHRPDIANEYIRRHNAAARMQAKHVIFVNVADDIVKEINLQPNRTIRINALSEIFGYGSKLQLRTENYLDWGQANIAIGLLTALRAKKVLRCTPDGPNASELATETGHLVICEDHEELATIQAANYAYSLGAGLKIIPTMPERERKQLLERLYSANAAIEGETRSPTERLRDIATELRQYIGGDLPNEVESLTFITSGIPWGFGYPEKPSTHLSTYPDLGIHLISALAAEQPGRPGIRVAAVIEPGQVNAAEVDVVIESLCRHNALVREYQGERATVSTVSEAIELFPYDLLFISSHCGDTSGWRWTYNFRDSEGKERELVVDVAASFAPRPGEDLIKVGMHNTFISLDGVAWDDPEKDKKLVVGSAMTDWMKLTQDEKLEPTHKQEVPRVHGSSAIKVYDHQLLIAPSQLASHNTPIVINNACLSWHRLAHTFTFMNARAYLGTLFEVSDGEAFEIIKLLFTKYFDRPLSVALWHAQNKVYGKSVRRPYVMTGPHFQRLRTVPGSKVDYLGRLLVKLHNDYVSRLKSNEVPEKFIKDWKDHIDFFSYEIDALRKGLASVSSRPSSAKSQDELRLILG